MLDNLRKFLFPEELIALDFELSKVELLTLLIVDRHGEIIMSQIADFIRVPLSTATGVINRLVKNGYLRRERNESDRRIVTVRLTETGQQIAHEFKDKISTYINLVVKALNDDEKQLLIKLATKIMDVMQNAWTQDTDAKESELRHIPID